MLKLKTLTDLQDSINNQISILETLTEDYLQLVDDDLFHVDLTAEPVFTDDWMLIFTTQHRLKQKYILRFCDDFGLTFVSETEKDMGHYTYLFKPKEDF